MQETPSNTPLDDLSRQVLLLLSHGETFSLHKVAQAIQQTDKAIFCAIEILEKHNFISKKAIDNGYQITKEGSEYLAINFGILVTKPTPPINPNKLDDTHKNYLFRYLGNFVALVTLPIWIIIPSVILSTFLAGTVALTIIALKLGLDLLLALLLILYVRWTFRIVKQSTTLVVFRLGICIGAKEPGPVLILPFLDKVQLVELKVDHKEISEEACITKDNVQIKVDFVYWWQIQDAEKSVTHVVNAPESIKKLATGALRAVIAGFDFGDLQLQRQSLNDNLQKEIGKHSADWGIQVTNVEIQEVKTSPEIKTAMEDWRAAKWRSETLIKMAEGQAEALNLLHAAAYNLDANTLNLKYFEMLQKLGDGRATKFIFPMEISNLIQSWLHDNQKSNGQTDKGNPSPALDNRKVPDASKKD